MVDDARAMLEQAVKGKSDEEIMGFVELFGGTDTALDMIFEGMKAALDPEKAQDCVVGYEIADNGTTHAYAVTVANGAASVEKREPSDARVTLGMTLPDFLRIVAGDLDGTQGFMAGKIKVKGDMMFAMQVPQMFDL
jgi:putative sterol carrier protein